jgi:glycosyltransferase involved in cell wall biosynthesis
MDSPGLYHDSYDSANMDDMSTEFPASLRSERILLMSESLGPINGVSRTNTNLILALQAEKVPLKLVAPWYTNSSSNAVDLGPIKRLGGAPLPYTPELTVAYPFRLDRISAGFKPTLIYLASPASVGFQALFQLRALHNPPVFMCNFQTDLSAYASIIFPAPLDKYCMWLLQLVQGWLYNHPSVHTIFYPSRPVRDYLVEAGVPEEKLVHLGRGVDTQLFNPIHRDMTWREEELKPTGKEIVLVSVGRLAPEKGFPFLASAVKKLATHNVCFKLLVVGGNRNASVERDIRERFAPLGARVRFTGFLEGTALARAYASGDMFLHCSVTETFGLVVLEAMACGLPVVARDAGGPSEIVKEGVSGFLTAPDDEDAFVAKVKELAENKAMRERMSASARRQAEATTWDAINLMVARRMQLALDERRLNNLPHGQGRFLDDGGVISNSQTINWVIAFAGAVITELKFTWAMMIVSFFWAIGVVPLLIHGNLVFSQKQGTKSEASTSSDESARAKDDGGETGRVAEGSRRPRVDMVR